MKIRMCSARDRTVSSKGKKKTNNNKALSKTVTENYANDAMNPTMETFFPICLLSDDAFHFLAESKVIIRSRLDFR